MSARQASNTAIFDKVRVVLTEIARAPVVSLAGKDPWSAVLKVIRDSQGLLLDRLGALGNTELSRYTSNDLIDMVAHSASALKAVLQLILQEQQLGMMHGFKVSALYHLSHALLPFITHKSGWHMRQQWHSS